MKKKSEPQLFYTHPSTWANESRQHDLASSVGASAEAKGLTSKFYFGTLAAVVLAGASWMGYDAYTNDRGFSQEIKHVLGGDKIDSIFKSLGVPQP